MKLRALLLPLLLAAGFGGGAIAQGLGNGGSPTTLVPGRGDTSNGSTAVAPSGAGGVAAGGSAQLFAIVEDDATLVRGKGAFSSVKLGVGTYQVSFARNITACVFTATIGRPGTGNPPYGNISVALRSGTSNAVFVGTTDTTGNGADRPFHLWVNC